MQLMKIKKISARRTALRN